MKLIRFGEPAKERPGLLLNDGTFIDTSGFRSTRVFDYDEEFFAGDGLAQLRESTHHRGHAGSPMIRNCAWQRREGRTTAIPARPA
jgi:hypothetical protein